MTPQEILEAYKLAYKEAAYPTIEQMRNAITAVYGDNNIGDLNDDGYVTRKFNAGLRGARGALLRQYAFNPPTRTVSQPGMASHNWVNANGGNMTAPATQEIVKAPKIPGYGIGTPAFNKTPRTYSTAYHSHAMNPNQAAINAQRDWIAQQRREAYNKRMAYWHRANQAANRRVANSTPNGQYYARNNRNTHNRQMMNAMGI